jgi:hypothetical protein
MVLSREHSLALVLEWARVVRGSALAHTGRPAEGIAEIRQSLQNQRAMRSSLEHGYCLTLLAEALGTVGEYSEALSACDWAVDFANRTEGRSYEAETHRIRGELLLTREVSQLGDAEAEFEQALDMARKRQCRLLELRAAVSYFRLQQKQGDSLRARQVLAEATAWFSGSADYPLLAEARVYLG